MTTNKGDVKSSGQEGNLQKNNEPNYIEVVNIKSYVKKHAVCWHGRSDARVNLWLYLEEIGSGNKYRIYKHAWLDSCMFWDGSFPEPLIIAAEKTKEQVITDIYAEIDDINSREFNNTYEG